ncbi:dihydrolipoyl dehydrogenase [Clostridium tepidiprofundi DSM 19306]|uniref:Dihydrolipoyl dehydrogenase n=1 Tax=Clostridium tepidiprofundi DSM 19306 TaxID=1121338 RepID=A0A151B677_9CLOT|nr:dihydrolipoyl dehydrogenase [Clostridium tepidiprofundi DSM 19306]
MEEGIKVDIAILGGGPAGYVAAIEAAHLGASVALVEEREIGGTCLNRGCIPTKALLRTTEISNLIQKSKEFSIDSVLKNINWNLAGIRKNRVVKNLRMGLEHLMKKNNVQIINGKGRIISSTEVVVETDDNNIYIKCKKLIITTGSKPLVPEIFDVKFDNVLTSDEALELEEIPSNIVIIGAGAIGLEFATMFNYAGSRVNVIEAMENVLPLEDKEITNELIKIMKRQGIKFKLSTKVKQIRKNNDVLEVVIDENNTEKIIQTEMILVAVGRKLNSISRDIVELGIKVDKGKIVVNEHMETNIEGVYAAGDVIGGKLLAHIAFAEGKCAVRNALGINCKVNYSAVPSCVYTNPEVASVGMNEESANEKGIDISVGRFNFRNNGRALCLGEREGFVKVIVDKNTNIILGAQILGANASEMISELTLAVSLGVKAELIADMIHPHPTLSEAIMEACGDAVGKAIHK